MSSFYYISKPLPLAVSRMRRFYRESNGMFFSRRTAVLSQFPLSIHGVHRGSRIIIPAFLRATQCSPWKKGSGEKGLELIRGDKSERMDFKDDLK
jgi:hypothetical protein